MFARPCAWTLDKRESCLYPNHRGCADQRARCTPWHHRGRWGVVERATGCSRLWKASRALKSCGFKSHQRERERERPAPYASAYQWVNIRPPTISENCREGAACLNGHRHVTFGSGDVMSIINRMGETRVNTHEAA